MIEFTVNGTAHRFQMPLNLDQLIRELDLGGKRIAVERNGDIVPRSQFHQVQIIDGDRLEIVVAVGGG